MTLFEWPACMLSQSVTDWLSVAPVGVGGVCRTERTGNEGLKHAGLWLHAHTDRWTHTLIWTDFPGWSLTVGRLGALSRP